MKAAQFTTYGGPEVIILNPKAEKPLTEKGKILIAVKAAAINPIDWKLRTGYLQEHVPLTFPATIGGDFAGIVSEAGEEVIDFLPGDEVYGQAGLLNGGTGSMAAFAVADAQKIAKKPKSLSFSEAAALPLAGISALQAIEEHIELKAGQKILIHGGAGGIGSIAVQLAKEKKAYVATTVSAGSIEFVKQLGADEAIDYKNQSFESMLHGFDAVFDTVGGETTRKSFAVLRVGGILVSMSGQPDEALAEKYGIVAIGQGTHANTTKLSRLAELIDTGKITVQVDKVFPFENVQEAFRYQEKGHPKGKVVVSID